VLRCWLCEQQESFANVAGGRHEDRLRGKLYQLARTHGKVGREGVEIALPLTHDLLAQMIACARETVTCTLARFRRDGLLSRSARGYSLAIPPAALEAPSTISTASSGDRARRRQEV
jgi:CRP-like cAMP-binding protein